MTDQEVYDSAKGNGQTAVGCLAAVAALVVVVAATVLAVTAVPAIFGVLFGVAVRAFYWASGIAH